MTYDFVVKNSQTTVLAVGSMTAVSVENANALIRAIYPDESNMVIITISTDRGNEYTFEFTDHQNMEKKYKLNIKGSSLRDANRQLLMRMAAKAIETVGFTIFTNPKYLEK